MKCPYGSVTETGTTADVAILIVASDLSNLFAASGWALGNLITDIRLVKPVITQTLSLESDDLAMLMVDWLTELLYLFETKQTVFSGFDTIVTGTQIQATLSGEVVRKHAHVFRTSVKAVTWHGLQIEQQGGVFRTRILFDV